ncbi:MAG: hypothetical protein JWN15_3824, partial [Firmicutes bacterium]|nr:hypothetical protein [Bacillota bacterium]
VPGLNFVGKIAPGNLIRPFGAILGGVAECTISGTITMVTTDRVLPPLADTVFPWQVHGPVPGIMLSVPFGGNLSLSKLTFDNLGLRIYCPLTGDWLAGNATYAPVVAVVAHVGVPSANMDADLTSLLVPGSQRLLLDAAIEGVSLDSLARLTDLANGNDLFDMLPTEIKSMGEALGGLSLLGISISLSGDFSTTAVEYIHLVVGMPNAAWTAAPGFTLAKPSADFAIVEPFGPQRAVSVSFAGVMQIAGSNLIVGTEYPGFNLRVSLQDQAILPLHAFFTEYLPELPAPPDLSVDSFELYIAPGESYTVTAQMLDNPPWTLELGPGPVSIGNVSLDLTKTAGGSAEGSFAGFLQLGEALQMQMAYQIPGNFMIRADLPEAKLSQLIASLNDIGIALPSGFDIDLKGTSVLIEKQAADLTFSAATIIDGMGLLAFTAEKQGQWGFAVGVDLPGGLPTVPGVAALAAFDSFVGLEKLMLVVSSIAQPGFQFPDMASFNTPVLAGQKLQLPPQASGLVEGFNFFAQLSTTKSQAFRALAKYLGVKLDGSIGITLGVSLPDPVTNSKLFLSVHEELQSGTTLTGELGGLLQGGEVGAFLTGDLKTGVQGQPMDFSVTAMVLENGLLIAGSMQGTIHFDPVPVQLSNLGLVIGLDWEGIPSLGIAATLDVANFNSALAIFFDSVDPAKSLFAGAVSDLSLLDVAQTLAGQASVPGVVGDVLGKIGLKGLQAFNMPASVGTALDNRDLGSIAGAFQQYGSTQVPGTSSNVLLEINTAGAVWHLTDLSTMSHYTLTRRGEQIAVALEAQIYCAPQDTYIGALKYPEGFHVQAEIDYLVLQAKLKVAINPSQGIAADASIAPVIIYSRDFFAVTDADGQTGPLLSLATFSQPNQPDAHLQGPHVLVTGKLRLLGMDISSTYVSVGAAGLQFQISQQVSPAVHLDVNGNFDSINSLDVSGGITIGISRGLDLGPLGSLHVDISVQGSLDMGYKNGSAYATLQAGFDFQGIHADIPKLNLDVNGQALTNIADTIWDQVKEIITKMLTNADQWLAWVKNGIIQGAGQTAQQVGSVLHDVYNLSANEVADKTHQVLGYGADGVAAALQGAGATADQAVQILGGLGYDASDVAKAIGSVFTSVHVDTSFGHLDTPAGPHMDTPTAHVDISSTHIDTSQHIDIPGTHADQDLGFLGHADTNITPHGDTSPHVDQTTTPHGDTSTPHADTDLPPHVDTGTHIDIKP